MTRTEMLTSARAGDRGGMPVLLRLVLGVPLAAFLGLAALLALSFTGWGAETDPVAQLTRDSVVLLISALGTVPALVMVSAYLTDRY